MFGLLNKKRIRVTLPKEVRVIAIGDIHGQLGRLSILMEKIDDYRKKNPIQDEHLVFLGDYTDRGPHSAPVIDYLCQRKKSAKNNSLQEIFLKGNHEELLFESSQGTTRRDDVWWRNGGKQSVQSYLDHAGFSHDESQTPKTALTNFREVFPRGHKEFYQDLKNYHQVGPLLFVHAGMRMDQPIEKQKEEDLFWIRGPFLNWQGPEKEFLVIHGHTITPNFQPEIHKHRIGIDTGSYRERGCITAAIFENNKVRFINSGSKEKFEPNIFS